MFYNEFLGEKISALGFGTMRLPTDKATGKIDREALSEMVECAMDGGVNYFDTAVPYHGGESEGAVGEALSKYPRDSYLLATKFPGHMITKEYNPEKTFEDQLKKCKVDYFDFYLLHNVCENSIDTYEDSRWDIINYFIEQKKNGKIRHLGFSSHGDIENLTYFLDKYGSHMEFCQIQMNYLDYSLQKAKEKYEMLTERRIPVIVMEPLRGGKLVSLDDKVKTAAGLDTKERDVELAFRFFHGYDNIAVVLSGMSTLSQMEDNINIFSERRPLSSEVTRSLFKVSEILKGSVPCTACRYCCDGCPAGLDIPKLITLSCDFAFQQGVIVKMATEALDKDKLPSACIGCGKCTSVCPQKIDVPKILKDFSDALEKFPDWAETCRKREEEQAKNK